MGTNRSAPGVPRLRLLRSVRPLLPNGGTLARQRAGLVVSAHMKALELCINNRLMATIGDAASNPTILLLATQGWTRGAPITVLLFAQALDPSGVHSHWQTPTLSPGDIIRIRPIDAAIVAPCSF